MSRNGNGRVRRLIALPGMDGTGRLLEGFAAAIGERLDTHVVAYPPEAFAYDALTERVASQLAPADGDYVLLAESFSGPIALRLAARRTPGLRGLVLVVTFAAAPNTPLLPLTKVIPTELLLSQPIPCWLSCQLMLNSEAPAGARDSFCDVIKAVSPRAISLRLREVRELAPPAGPVDLPALYVQAENDRILPTSALDDMRRWVPELTVYRLPGPHLVLSARPQQCADRVVEFVRSLEPS